MDDEAVVAEQPLQRSVEVVPYSVVSGEVDRAAEDAASGAADAVLDRVESVTADLGATVDSVAGRAADDAAQRVYSMVLDSKAVDEGDTQVTTYTVQIDQTQYDALMLASRRQLGASFLTMCLAAICAGIMLWGFVSREFR